MTFNLLVQQARPRDAFPVLISLLLLHAAPYNLARKCTSLRPINLIKSAPVCCELKELLGYLRFPAQNPIGLGLGLEYGLGLGLGLGVRVRVRVRVRV